MVFPSKDLAHAGQSFKVLCMPMVRIGIAWKIGGERLQKRPPGGVPGGKEGKRDRSGKC
jgi:hypothetical protein